MILGHSIYYLLLLASGMIGSAQLRENFHVIQNVSLDLQIDLRASSLT